MFILHLLKIVEIIVWVVVIVAFLVMIWIVIMEVKQSKIDDDR